MNALTADEKAIWIAVYAGEVVWSRKATDTTNMKGAHRAADNAVAGFRAIEAEQSEKASLEAASVAEVTRAAEQSRKAEKQREANRR